MIEANDIIKVGRVKFKVREFRTETETFDITKNGEYEEFKETRMVAEVPEEDLNEMCRFCWVQEYTDDNPKVGTCNCLGSVKYIHFQCLKAWLQTKMNTKQTATTHTLSWKHFECELCKMHYPCKLLLLTPQTPSSIRIRLGIWSTSPDLLRGLLTLTSSSSR